MKQRSRFPWSVKDGAHLVGALSRKLPSSDPWYGGAGSWRRYMELRKYGVEIACEQCRLIRGDSAGGFDIVVPVSMGDSGVAGTARLHCAVSGDQHQVKLMGLRDGSDRAMEPSPEAMGKLSAALDSVARHRICGNQHVCPADVVRIVAGQGRD